jgi:rSAM/selenodomain-associated transferase 1
MGIRNTLVIMAKTPSAGRMKTRLAKDIGVSEALRFYRYQLTRTCRILSNHPGWELVLSRSPDHGKSSPAVLVDKVIEQGAGDLGTRMQRLFDRVGRGPLIIIGADIPGITPMMITNAFHLLKGHDLVFGPAIDGGYWLVGQRRMPRVKKRIFKGVRWSDPHTLEDTLDNLQSCSVAYVDRLYDVDTGADLGREVGK